MTVTAGQVSALRREDDVLTRIQIDASVTFGNSGGPVLDKSGKVIGVVVSGILNQRGLNLAIPVGTLQRFLDAPDIEFAAPELSTAALEQPATFKAKVTNLVPGRKEPSVRLILQAGDEKPREFPMTGKNGEFVASAAPAAKSNAGKVELEIHLRSGAVTGPGQRCRPQGRRPADATQGDPQDPVQADGEGQGSRSETVVLAGTAPSVEARVEGLGPVEVQLGDMSITIDLRKATQIQVLPAAEVAALQVAQATVVASVDGIDVARLEEADSGRRFEPEAEARLGGGVDRSADAGGRERRQEAAGAVRGRLSGGRRPILRLPLAPLTEGRRLRHERGPDHRLHPGFRRRRGDRSRPPSRRRRLADEGGPRTLESQDLRTRARRPADVHGEDPDDPDGFRIHVHGRRQRPFPRPGDVPTIADRRRARQGAGLGRGGHSPTLRRRFRVLLLGHRISGQHRVRGRRADGEAEHGRLVRTLPRRSRRQATVHDLRHANDPVPASRPGGRQGRLSAPGRRRRSTTSR